MSPFLPGLVYADPDTHAEVAAAQKGTGGAGGEHQGDAITIAHGVIKKHAEDHPECVAPLRIAKNEGRGLENPFLEYTKTILTPDRFPRLVEMFRASSPPQGNYAEEIQALAELRDAGTISQAQFDEAFTKILPERPPTR
jgi:hypothetical protein